MLVCWRLVGVSVFMCGVVSEFCSMIVIFFVNGVFLLVCGTL